MKFCVVLKPEQMETMSMEELLGSTCGNTCFDKLRVSDEIENGNAVGNQSYSLYCTGSFLEYLSMKRFFGKNQIYKFNY